MLASRLIFISDGDEPSHVWHVGYLDSIHCGLAWWHRVCMYFSSMTLSEDTNCDQSGMQAYYGGLAVTLIIGAVIPGFHDLKNTLPARYAHYHLRPKELTKFDIE